MKNLFLLLLTLVAMQIAAIAQTTGYKYYAWEGKMGESISFRIELEHAPNGLVKGETTYFRKNGKITDIPVYGKFMAFDGVNELVLHEYDQRTQCGTIIITLEKDGKFKTGEWSNLEKTLEFNDITKQDFSFGKHETFFNPTIGAACNGEYGFKYKSGNPNNPEYGGYASLKVSGNTMNWEMNQVTPNIADGKGRSTINGNTFSGQTSNFKFKAYVYCDCLYVVCLNPEVGQFEDFGAWATLEGIYIKY